MVRGSITLAQDKAFAVLNVSPKIQVLKFQSAGEQLALSRLEPKFSSYVLDGFSNVESTYNPGMRQS